MARRTSYVGTTDKYLTAALSGHGILDVTGTFWTDHQRDYTHTRIQRYQRNWRFYRGEHFQRASMDGKRKLVINMLRPIVDKSVDWLFGNGFKFATPPGNEAILPWLELTWQQNGRDLMSWEHGQMGAVSGDAYWYITVQDRDVLGKPIPLDDQRIVIRTLNSAYVHPIYDSGDTREMLACVVQFPSVNVPLNMDVRYRGNLGLYTIYITRDRIVEYWNREEIPGSKRVNLLGVIPVVHTRNTPIANSFFGASDIEDIIPLNEEYNNVAEDIDSIIKYHAAPTTIVYGTRASLMEKGPNKVWSGLPKDSRVENLALQSELVASVEHLAFMKRAIMELSNTPEQSLGQTQEISNTSAAALEVQYLPLIEKTRRKYLTYGEGIRKANEIIIRIVNRLLRVPVSQFIGDPARMYETTVTFNSPLPQDEKLKIDLIAAKKKEGLESTAGALRELGEKDIVRKVLEIIADRRAELATDVERALAVEGAKTLNTSVTQLDSLGISHPELQQAFQGQDEAMDELSTEARKDVEKRFQPSVNEGSPAPPKPKPPSKPKPVVEKT